MSGPDVLVVALAPLSRKCKWTCAGLIVTYIASVLSVFPKSLAYANEAWGGARNTHRVLNDSNLDWGRQLYQVKEWEDRHPGEECWFAYTVSPFIHPETYGVHSHVLPNGLGGGELVRLLSMELSFSAPRKWTAASGRAWGEPLSRISNAEAG